MKHKIDYYGYVYKWTNTTNGMKYIGSHYGSVEDYYVGSGKEFTIAYKQNPEEFVMEVLEYVKFNNKKLVLETEKKWLDSVYNIKDHPEYYNLNNNAAGGFGYINQEHIIIRANTLKQRHKQQGLSEAEKNSYKKKIQSRLDRISKAGFTPMEQVQHAKYGYQISVTTPAGITNVYNSCGQASRDLGIDVQYGLKVCSSKGIDFKGHKIVKLRDPLVDCR
jgi:uncharacterized protein YnzC (UPF0291/DUF896 family)